MAFNSQDLFDKLVSVGGIFKNIFGDKLFNNLVYDVEYEENKRILREVYGYTQLDDIF